VVNPSRVQLLGGWNSVLDTSSKSLRLKLHEPFSLEFDTRSAGPGTHAPHPHRGSPLNVGLSQNFFLLENCHLKMQNLELKTSHFVQI